MKNAWQELHEQLEPGETVEAIVFGPWGWGSAPCNGGAWEPGYREPLPPPVPFEKRGVLMTLAEAEPFMQSWKFRGGHGAAQCYAVRIWTGRRVLWITEYDGSTCFNSAPRNPVAHIPDMPGGG